MEHQSVRGDQHHLEEDEEVEDVAREEGAVEAEKLEMEQRVEVPSALVPTRDGVEQHSESQPCGEDQHGRRQAIEHENDAERRRPGAEPVGVGFAVAHGAVEEQCYPQQGEGRGDREDPLHLDIAPPHQDHHCRGDGRQDGGRDNPAGGDVGSRHRSASVSRSNSSSGRSAVSVAVSRNPRSASTTIKAVMPNEMTIAVSTSACGSGSV